GTLAVADVGGDAADGIGGAVCARQQELDRQGSYGRASVGERLLVDAGAAGRQEVGVVLGEAGGDLSREQVGVGAPQEVGGVPPDKLSQGFVRQQVAALPVLGEDAGRGVVQDGGEAGLDLPQRLLGLPAV